jgi:CheY-like chemotaxis protein
MADKPLILVVDDEEVFRGDFIQMLYVAGFRVETANGGEEGIEKAKSLKPDLILLEIMISGMDGATAALKLKDDPATRDIKIAFLTSLGEPRADMRSGDENLAKGLGAVAYFKKTNDLQNLAMGVGEILKQ